MTAELQCLWLLVFVSLRLEFSNLLKVYFLGGTGFQTKVLSGERLRARYDKEDTILAFEGATKGWVQCCVESASESTWPQIMVAGSTLQGTDEALPIPHFLIRPSTRMEGFSS